MDEPSPRGLGRSPGAAQPVFPNARFLRVNLIAWVLGPTLQLTRAMGRIQAACLTTLAVIKPHSQLIL